MNKYILSALIFLAAMLQVKLSLAQYKGQAYTVTNIKDLSVMTGSNDTMKLFDGVLSSVPQSDTNWQGLYYFSNVRGTVALKIKKDLSGQAIPESFTCEAVVAVQYWETSHTGSLPAASNINLKISYDKRKGLVYDEAALKVYHNAHYIFLDLVSVSNAAVKPFLQLQITLDGERNYLKEAFDINARPCILKTEYLVASDEWEVTFKDDPLLDQANEFDLEWTFVDYYDKAAYDAGAKTGNYSFKNNATRIILGKNQRTFRLKNIFERGFVVFRYRTVAYYPQTTLTNEEVTLRLTGAWSDGNGSFSGDPENLKDDCDETGVQSSLAIIDDYSVETSTSTPHLEQMNWQYISVFAEEAKSKETLAYYDGSMRARQNLATNNSDNTLLVQENIYDFNGRAAIQVLPVPVKLSSTNKFTFYPNLNKEDASTAYTAYSFDQDASNECESSTPAMFSVANSAAEYYSTGNTFKGSLPLADWDMNRFIPVAGGFPFTQTVFTRDNTGRIASQSGVGETHHLQAHKTRYAYETPHQEELTRLFGTDVGFKDHYKKNTVIDANGQVSVSYLDLKGHTIATALAANPTGTNKMRELDGITLRENIVVSLLNTGETQLNNDEFVYSKKIFVPESGSYQFSYSLNPQDYQPDACPETTPCYDCTYELEVKLVNGCGENVLDGDAGAPGTTLLKRTIGGASGQSNYSPSCSTNTAYSFGSDADLVDEDGFISVSLEPGEYTISRSLKIDESAYRKAEQHYMENSVCKNLDFFLNAELENIDLNACYVTCESCSAQFNPEGGPLSLEDFLVSMEGKLGKTRNLYTAEEVTEWTNFYTETKKKCDELSCGNRTECDVVKDILVSDVTPGGQYAAFTYEENVFTVTSQSLNILSPGFIENLPESLTVYIDGISVLANTLSPEDFVKNWNPEWAEYLITAHPEYCEYAHCTGNASAYEKEAEWMAVSTYADALTAGYFQSPTHPTKITASEVSSITSFSQYHEMDFDDNTPPTPGNLTDDDDVHWLSMEEVALFHIFYRHLSGQSFTYTEFTDMIADARSTKFDECGGAMKDLYWNMLKGMILDAHRKKLEALRPACPSTEDEEKVIERRFYTSTTDWPELNGEPVDKSAAGAAKGIADHCASQCESYRDIWKDNLKDCDIDAPTLEILLDSLEAVCKRGCDANNPMGSRTVSPSNLVGAGPVSFEQVMRSFINGNTGEPIYDFELCSDLHLSMPMAYGHDLFSTSSPYSDTCECDGPEPPVNCPCSGSSAYNTTGNTTAAKLLRGESLPEDKCKHCYDCSATANAFYDFSTIYPLQFGVSVSYDKLKTEELLVKFFNTSLGLNLTYDDYQLHLAKCLGYNEVPTNTDIFDLYVKTYTALRSFTTKETNLVAAVIQHNSMQQFKYEYSKPENNYRIDYSGIQPAYASLSDGAFSIEQATATGDDVNIYSMGQKLSCICNQLEAHPEYFVTTGGYFTNPGGGASDAAHVNRIKSICETRNRELKKCTEDNYRIAAQHGIDMSLYPYMQGWMWALGMKSCYEVDDNIRKYLETDPLNVDFTSLGTVAFGCSTCNGDCPPDNTEIHPPKGEQTNLAFCKGFMPYFEDYYNDYIRTDFESGPIHSMDLMNYLGNDSYFDNTEFSALVAYLVSKDVIEQPGVNDTRQEILDELWETLRLCRTVSCETFMQIATDYDENNESSLANGLRSLAESGSTLPIYTDFRDELNAEMNKPPYLVFFDNATVVKHFVSCSKGPCEVIIEEFQDIKVEFFWEFTEDVDMKALRENMESGMMTAFLSYVNERLKRAPFFNTMNKEQLIAAVEMCVSCTDSYNPHPISGVLPQLITPPPGFVSIFPLLATSGWNIKTAAPNIASLFFAKSPYRDAVNYRVVTNALDNSFLHGEARPPAGGNYFYIKMATIMDYATNAYDALNYMPATPDPDFAFVRIIQFTFKRVVRFSQLEVQVIARAEFNAGGSSTAYQDLLITMPAYAFYTDYISTQICKHNNEICNRPATQFTVEITEDPCVTRLKLIAKANAYHKYNDYVAGLKENFRTGYIEKCMKRGTSYLNEQFNMKYNQRQYQYTLYYYDQAGNLVKTVPPAGVEPLNSTNTGTADTKRLAGDPYSTTLSQHTKVTTYLYNSLNQLVEQHTPDAGKSEFWYDKTGRLVLSQNAKQYAASPKQYSYTFYDGLGRITEVGQLENASNDSITQDFVRTLASVEKRFGVLSLAYRKQVTKTFYDVYTGTYSTATTLLSGDFKNLRGRVVHSATYEDASSTMPEHAVHYSYDMHGNVSTLYRETPALENMGQDVKQVNYYFDLVSGKVNRVVYQEGAADQYLHVYRYDAENRLVNVKTGTQSFLAEDDANYYYYKHGPLARMEYGEHDVQGLDYTYTIQGWLKSVNAPTLDHTRDPGRDGYTSSDANRYNGRDAFGFELSYFAGDYTPVHTFGSASEEAVTTVPSGAEVNHSSTPTAPNLYNGNIRYMVTGLKGFNPLLSAYQYDQLNRIREANYYSDLNQATNTWGTGAAMDAYFNSFTYDADGNIMTQVRKGKAGSEAMDDLDYHYTSGSNKLDYVSDNETDGLYPDDIDNQASGNYTYDATGNLVSDAAEEIAEIKWNVYGKITNIIRRTNSHKPDLVFTYTPDGHRASKTVIAKNNSLPVTTYYIRDAQGNVLATYNHSTDKVLDYANLDYDAVNTKLKDLVGIPAFAEFIAQLHSAHINNAAFDEPLHNSFISNTGALESRLSEMNPEAVLSSSAVYGNWVLKHLNRQDVSDNLLGGNQAHAYEVCGCAGGGSLNIVELIMAKPTVARAFFEALCEYDNNYSTTYATDVLNGIYSGVSCPLGGTVISDIENDLDQLNDNVHANHANFTSGIAGTGMSCDDMYQVLNYMELNSNSEFLAMMDAMPTNSMLATWDDFIACGGSLNVLNMLSGLREPFLKALYRSDASLFATLVAQAGFTYTTAANGVSDLMGKTSIDLETDMNAIGLAYISPEFRNALVYMYIQDPAAFNALVSAFGTVSPTVLCATADAYSCNDQGNTTGNPSGIITAAGGYANAWSYLLAGLNTPVNYAGIMKAEDKYNYLQVVVPHYLSLVDDLQQSTNLYGGTDNGMAAYFNYIRGLINESTYASLVNYFIQDNYLYADTLKLEEWMLYGSSRLGSHRLNKPVAAITYTGAYENVELVYEAPCPHELTDFILVRGNKRYELSNHLGNVLTVVSDKKIPVYIPNPLHDGDFSTDEEGWTGGWSAAGSGWIPAPSPPYTTVAQESGRLKVTATQGYGGARLLFATTPGKIYTFTFTLDKGTVPVFQYGARTVTTLTPPDTYGGTGIYWTTTNSSLTNQSFSFTATTSYTQILFEKYGDAGTSRVFYLDDTKVVEEGSDLFSHYEAEVMQVTDYSPFGAPLPGRTYNAMEEMNKVVVAEGTPALTGWSTANSSTSVSNDAVKVTFTTTNTGAVSMNKTLSTTAGKQYRLSFNADAATYTNVSVEIVGYNNTALSSATLNTGITHYQLDFTANDVSTVIKVSLGTGTGTRTIYIDNVKLEEIKGDVSKYAFGFNGMEADNEVSGAGNAYTTFFRELDPRLGRWMSPDPKASAWQSPYVSMNNNPIVNTDVMGDIIDGDKKAVDDLKNDANKKISKLDGKMGSLQAKIDKRTAAGKDVSALTARMNNLSGQKTELNSMLSEISTMESSSQVYNISKGSGGLAGTLYNSTTGNIDISYVSKGTLAHELKHGFQFESGSLSFDATTGKPGFLYDINDEMEAYQRQWLFGGAPFKTYGDITPANIRALDGSYGTQYGRLLNVTSNVTINTTLNATILNHHFTSYDPAAIGMTGRDFINAVNKSSILSTGKPYEIIK